MYNNVWRNVFTGANILIKSANAGVLGIKHDKSSTAFFRLANAGAKGLRTGSIKLCEKTEEISPPKQEGEINSDNKSAGDLKTNPVTETPTENTEGIQHFETTTAPITENESVDQPDAGKLEETKPLQGNVKKGKQGLLELLGEMKVEVTSKRKLQNPNPTKKHFYTPRAKSMLEKATVTTISQSTTLAPELVAAASAAASTLPNPSDAESELLKQLQKHETITETQKKGEENNIGVILADMKIGKYTNQHHAHPANQTFGGDEEGYKYQNAIIEKRKSVRKVKSKFTAKRLDIFSASEMTAVPTDARPTLWDLGFANQLSAVSNPMPRNGFEEMIYWTQQGKMWQYPIDNEAGLEEEAIVPFHEHIFLEKYLEEGFPRKGPIRHFMELVIAGLSKNPHLTVQQKKDHIFWFRDYFSQKEEILKEDNVHLN